LPPLRERGKDLLLLVSHFHARFSKELDGTVPQFSDEALRRMLAYHWPGNVRELENLVQKLVLMCEGECIEVADLPAAMKTCPATSRRLDRPLADHESEYIREVLASVGGNKTKAAAILQIDRKTLREKLKLHGV
jgi:two-component system, NtrC family, response regulator HydG